MAFPASILPLVTEVYIDGAGVDVSSRRRIESGLTISRGRGDWSSRAVASRGDCVFENADAYFSNRRADSPNFGKLGRNTQLPHRIRWVYDTFTRTASSSWGTPDVGPAWTTSGGSASDYSVSSGTGRQSLGTVNVERAAAVAQTMRDFDVTFDATNPVTPTGNVIERGVRGRWVDGSNFVDVRVYCNTDNTVSLIVRQLVAGVETTSGFLTISGLTTTSAMTCRFQAKGSTIRAKLWATGSEEPDVWNRSMTTTFLSVGTFVFYTVLAAGNTNALPVVETWDNVQVSDYRFWGETSAFGLDWAPKGATGTNVTAPVEAAGIMRRLGTGAKPLNSALYRAMIGVNVGDYVPVAYWPHEDGSDATQIASAMPGQPAANFAPGAVTPASYSGFAGSLPLPTIDNGTIKGQFPSYTDNDIWETQFAMMIPSGLSGSSWIYSVTLKPGNTVREFRVNYQSGSLYMQALDPSGVEMVNATLTSAQYQRDTPYLAAWLDFYHTPTATRHVQFVLKDTSGALVSYIDFQPDGGGAGTPGVVDRWQVQGLTGTTGGWAFGHHALFTNVGLYGADVQAPNARAAGGYVGETAADRMTRLCREEGIYFELLGTASTTAAMGPQSTKTLLDLLFECADADQGILFEPRNALGISYRTRVSTYNQTGLTLNYTSGQVFPPFLPVEDDQLIANDVTVKRAGGSSTRAVVTAGPLGTDTVGTYDVAPEFSLYTDAQTGPLAQWLAHLGTWDEARYPSVTVNMAAPAVASNASLMAQIAAVDIGDYIAVTNPPPWLPPDTVELLVQGVREFYGDGHEWQITWNCVPAGPYTVGVYGTSRYDSTATTTNEALDTTETGVDYTVAAGHAGWATTATNPSVFPFDIVISGERMTVTSATASTFTVTRSVNTIVKSDATGVDVRVYRPGRYAL